MEPLGIVELYCVTCERQFSSTKTLNIHLKIHKKTPYACKDCDKFFPHPSHLKRHERIHTGEKPFPCSECGQPFTKYNNLKKHQLVHLDKKPFTCPQYDKSFTLFTALKQHDISKHTGVKPYKCLHCDWPFINFNSMNFHAKRHNRTNDHKCSKCKESFPIYAKLKQHFTNVHRVYCCSLSDQSFKCNDDLKRHHIDHTKKTEKNMLAVNVIWLSDVFLNIKCMRKCT